MIQEKPSRKDKGMRPLRNRLQEARKRLGIPWEVLERDYVLSSLLAGVSRVEVLRFRRFLNKLLFCQWGLCSWIRQVFLSVVELESR